MAEHSVNQDSSGHGSIDNAPWETAHVAVQRNLEDMREASHTQMRDLMNFFYAQVEARPTQLNTEFYSTHDHNYTITAEPKCTTNTYQASSSMPPPPPPNISAPTYQVNPNTSALLSTPSIPPLTQTTSIHPSTSQTRSQVQSNLSASSPYNPNNTPHHTPYQTVPTSTDQPPIVHQNVMSPNPPTHL